MYVQKDGYGSRAAVVARLMVRPVGPQFRKCRVCHGSYALPISLTIHCERQRTGSGLVSRAWPVQTAMRNCTRDEGGPFEVGNQVLTSSHRKLLSSKAMVVNVAETSGHDPDRHD